VAINSKTYATMGVMNLKKFRPLGNRLLVNPQRKLSPDSPIIIPLHARQELLWRAVVVSKGSYVTGIKNRDVVIYAEKAGVPIEVDGHTFVLLKLEYVIGTI